MRREQYRPKAAVAVLAAAAALSGGMAFAETSKADPGSPVVMRPGQGLPLDVGGKRVVGYYTQEKEACGLTIVLAQGHRGDIEMGNADGPQGTRVTVEVAPGKSLKVDGEQNKTAEFLCGPNGRKMNARIYERDGYKGKSAGKAGE